MPKSDLADWTRGTAKFLAVSVLGAVATTGIYLGLARTSAQDPVSHTRVHPPDTTAAGAPSDERAPSAAPAGEGSLASRIDLNTASRVELESLPGIGPALAKRIIENRAQFGRFATVESLTRVKGIGPRTLERLRPLVRAGP